jgi:hypothetical protein
VHRVLVCLLALVVLLTLSAEAAFGLTVQRTWKTSLGSHSANGSAVLRAREPGVTFIYAHARTGMFLPLLTGSKINNGASLIGMTVRVYTSDSKVVTYTIDKVRRHVTSAQNAAGVMRERLWPQTSEGPNYTYPKLIVEAHRVSTASTTYSISHPTPHPISC